MSEKSKGDTSRVVKNSLLSASVTGLTFDDFSCTPVLLPAAPPIERAPPSPPVLDLNSSAKEPSPVQNFEIDSDAFSEINLNATVDEDSSHPGPSFLSPLEETQITSESSILSQAASSFSQLPSVASSVFSTFSKVIKDYTPTTTQSNVDRDFIQPELSPPAYAPFYSQPPEIHSDISSGVIDQTPPEPPKLYSPAEIPSNPLGPGTSAQSQNTYRLSAKKKTYAQIPGLSSNFHHPPAGSVLNEPPLQPPVAQNLPPISPPIYAQEPVQQIFTAGPVFDLQATSSEVNQFNEPAVKKEERRGLFSLTNVVAPVWQNLSGLVGKTSVQEQQPVSTPFFEPPTSVGHHYDNSGLPNIEATNPKIYSQQTSAQFYSAPSFVESVPNSQPAIPQQSVAPVFQSSNIAQIQPSGLSEFVQTNQSVPPLQQIPPVGLNNNFRLQKGTRHYRSALPPSASSPPNIIQPPLSQNFQPEPFSPFNPIASNVTNQPPQPTTSVPFSPPSVPFSPAAPAPLFQPVPFAPFGQAYVPKEEIKPDVINFQTQTNVPTEPIQSVPLFPSVSQNTFFAASAQVASNVELFNPISISTVEPSNLIGFGSQSSDQNAPLYSQPQPIVGNQTQALAGGIIFNPIGVPVPLEDTTEAIKDNFQDQAGSVSLFTPPILSTDAFQDKIDSGGSLFQPFTTTAEQFTPLVQESDPTEAAGISSDVSSQNQKNIAQPESFQSVSLFAPVPLNEETDKQAALEIKRDEVQPEPTAPEYQDLDLTDRNRTSISTQIFDPIPVFAPIPTIPTTPFPDLHASPASQTTPVFAPIPAPIVEPQPQLFAEVPLQQNYATPSDTISVEAPLDKSPKGFNLTNYFQSQAVAPADAAPFTQPPTDYNTNSNLEQSDLNTLTTPHLQQHQTEITHFFNQTNPIEDTRNNNTKLPDPLSFFDSFHQSPIVTAQQQPLVSHDDNSNYDTKTEDESNFQIQNFFNNPPQNLNQSASELNYKLVGSNFINKNFGEHLATSRAISPQSNVVEPPSSSCSEFSSEISSQYLSKLTNDDILGTLNTAYSDPDIMASLISSKANPNTNVVYRPAVKHWFYKKKVDDKYIWTPFSQHDSTLIEEHFCNEEAPKMVAVEGGRYDVNIEERTRLPIFWSGDASEVRRCSWFYKAVDSRYVPYEEDTADKLEREYEEASVSGEWHRKIALPTGETVVFHGATVLVHFLQTQPSDSWGTTTQTTGRPRIVKRDLDDFSIESGESNKVDHILFMVHGIGSVCDLKFRTVEEVVDEFRSIGMQLIQSHYKQSCDGGQVGRVEVLPVSWHSELHSQESGIDEKLKAITLESIPKLRNFANDTLLDVLFYTSPVFCQNIMDTVAGTMNKVYSKYCQRNPSFKGSVSLAGHSLGSLILFDLLCHQKVVENVDMQNSENPDQPIMPLQFSAQTVTEATITTSKQISYTVGPAGTGQPFISYPQLNFQPRKFFALGSPIGMFVTIRGIDGLGLNFKLPTCPGFYNIFHPYDPVAYRIEALVNADLSTVRPVLIPHHKGRKRMHLELKETMTRVGADIKQRIVDTFKNTFGTVYSLTSKQKSDQDPNEIEREVDKVLEMQLKMDKEPRSRTNSTSTQSDIDTGETDIPLGTLNKARRIDYVLQEAPLEFFNEYLFALRSHVCYWESEDTILFIMKEIYSALGVQTDIQIPQQTMTIERPDSNSCSLSDHPGPSRA